MQAGTGAVKQAHTGGLEFLFWRKESFADCESSQKKGDKKGDKNGDKKGDKKARCRRCVSQHFCQHPENGGL